MAKFKLLRGCQGALALGFACVPWVAIAQDAVHHFDIASGPLATALDRVSEQSGQAIIYASDAPTGQTSSALRGDYTTQAALDRLLVGTGLSARFQDGGFVVMRMNSAPQHSGSTDAPADVLVTGTRLRGGTAASSVLVTSREQMLERGQTNLGEFARAIPQNFSGGQNPTVFVSSGANENVTNASALDLRGLGPDATLTLINGHRVAYDGVSQAVDISAIPLLAVERVEVVPDGSSAIYGSDAVGGVANVILRRDYDGALASARYGFTTDGGFQQQQYSGIAGKRWSGGGVMLSADYLRWTPITAGQRSFASSVSPSDPILPRQQQFSAVLAGHQQLSDRLSFSFDSAFADRRSPNAFSNDPPNDAFADGQVLRRAVRSWSLAPTLTYALSHAWTLTASGMYSESDTAIVNHAFFDEAEFQTTSIQYDNSASSAELEIAGTALHLPGGPVRVAGGLGYRENGLDFRNAVVAAGTSPLIAAYTARRDVFYGYGEASLPLFGPDNARAGVQALSLTGAVRYERYGSAQGVATPKAGLIYSPVAGLTLKGSWGKSFKAPTINQAYQDRNVALLGGASIQGYPATRTFLYLYGAGGNLRAEKATTWSGSIVLEPSQMPHLRFEATAFGVTFRDRVTTPLTSVYAALSDPLNADLLTATPSAALQASLIAASTYGLRNFTGGSYDPASVGLIVDNRLRNASREIARGVDVAVTYWVALGAAKLTARSSASYLDSKRQPTLGSRFVQLAGTLYDPPHWRSQSTIAYERARSSAAVTINTIGSVTDDRPATPYRVGGFVSLDATLRLGFTAHSGPLTDMVATIAIQNLLDEKPGAVRPLDALDPSWDSTNYPSIGRAVSLTLSKAL